MSTTLEHQSGDRLRFGPFELRPSDRLLHCEGAPLPIGSRAMDILLCLLERPGDVVSADELLASAWRGLNVDPAALRVQLSALRKALAAADPQTRYVSSIAGRGYCFVAPVSRDADPPPAAATPGRPGLPPAPRRMIGREMALEALARTIAAERLVSLVGPGGIGKTTVALALAHRLWPAFDGAVVFVDLAVHRGDHSVAGAVAAGLQLSQLGDDPLADIAAQLSSRRLLLILDSCEHVIAGAAALAAAVCQLAPQCHVVATSREPLAAPDEQVIRLDALETPPAEALSFEAVLNYPAAQLFVERAAAGGGEIHQDSAAAALVADICRKLDGIPLAIELAAGRVDAFGLATTHALLESRLQLSWPGLRTAPPRHLTLGATLDWSYDLLSSEEAALLRSLSTFAGWFPLGAAAAVAADWLRPGAPDALAELVAKSLVSASRDRSTVQYRLLDTTRDYARLKLEAAGEFPAAASRHAAWILDDLERQSALRGENPTFAWLEYYRPHIPDAQAALDWSLSEHGDRSFTVPLTIASRAIWGGLHKDGLESRRRVETALSIAAPDSREEMILNLLLGEALLDFAPFDMGRVESASVRALELATRFDDLYSQMQATWRLLNAYILTRPNIPKARAQAQALRKICQQHGGTPALVMSGILVGISELLAGNLAAARAASDWVEELGATTNGYSNTTRVSVLWLSGMPDAAVAAALVNLDRARATGAPTHVATALADSCGALAMCVGDWAGADRYADLIDDCVERGAFLHFRTWAQALRATVAARRGDAGPGRSLLSGPAPTEWGHPRYALVLTELARRLGAAGAEDVGRDLADRLLQRVEATGERWIWSEVQRVRGELARDPDEAERLFEAALAVAEQQGARAWALRAATSLARRRRSAAEDVLKPLLASFTEGAGTQDIVEARAVLTGWGLKLDETHPLDA